MAYGGAEGLVLETRLGPVVARQATPADLPWLNAVAEPGPAGRASFAAGWKADVESGSATALADPDGTVWGFLNVGADMDDDVSLRWLVPARRAGMVGPVVVAVALELAGRGFGPVGLVVREDARELLSELCARGFVVDGETTRGGRVGLAATRSSLARAVSPSARRPAALAEASDEELAAEVARRKTMAGAVFTLADVREELRLGGHGIDEAALDDVAGRLLGMVRTGLSARMERAGTGHLSRKWEEAGEHILEGILAKRPAP